MEHLDPVDLETILAEDGWVVATYEYSDAVCEPSGGLLLSLTAPTGARFDASGPSRVDALRSAALLAGLVEPDGPELA